MPGVIIKHWITGATLYEAAQATTIREAVEAAVRDGANLGGAYLRGVNLRGAYLDGANLDGVNLRGANLGGAYLRGVNLRGANLRGAYLRGANLGGAYLRGANLDGAYLRGVNLDGVNLRGANLDGVTLENARQLLFIGPIGSRSDTLRAIFAPDGVRVATGCFTGTLDEFEARVRTEHGESVHATEYHAVIAMLRALAPTRTPAVTETAMAS